MYRVLLSLLLLVSWANPLMASNAANYKTKIDTIFAEMNTSDTPGCALSMVENGNIIYKNGYGMSNLEHNIPISTNSVFHVASTSKQFTVFSIALLVEQGKVSWDDDIRLYIPEMPEYDHTITLRHLAHNISGVRDQWELLLLSGWRWEADLVTQRDAMRLITRQKSLNFIPGANYSYSNSGFTLLAEVVHKVSGLTLRQFTQKHIFSPLRMNNTHFHDDHEMIVKNRTHGYRKQADNSYKISNPDFSIVGATSLFTTVEDLALWDRNFYTMEIGEKEAVSKITTRGVLNSGEKIDYARSLVHGKHRGLATVSHGGIDAGYRAQFIRYPDQNFTIALLCNSFAVNPGQLAQQVAEVYLAEYMDPDDKKAAPNNLSSPITKSFQGTYLRDHSNQTINVEYKDGQLMMDVGGYKGVGGFRRLVPIPDGGNRFSFGRPGDYVEFIPGNTSEDMSIRMISSMTRISARRIDTSLPPIIQLADYVGKYYSEELEMTYYIRLESTGNLSLSFTKHEDLALIPKYKDAFVFSKGFISVPLSFTRHTNGRVKGFIVSSVRAWNIAFDRID